MADDYFETERYRGLLRVAGSADLDEMALDYFESADFDRVLVETVHVDVPARTSTTSSSRTTAACSRAWCATGRAERPPRLQPGGLDLPSTAGQVCTGSLVCMWST